MNASSRPGTLPADQAQRQPAEARPTTAPSKPEVGGDGERGPDDYDQAGLAVRGQQLHGRAAAELRLDARQ